MEGKQFQLEGMNDYSPEVLERFYESHRIQASDEFKFLYSDYEEDMKRTSELAKLFNKGLNSVESLGKAGEALVFKCIDDGALGSHITARGTNPYDDYFHGADMVIESQSRQLRDPIVSAIDITLNQKNVANIQGSSFETGKPEQAIGFDKKLERIKRHIEFLASMPDNYAIELSAWIQRGGLAEKHTKENERKFRDAENLMSLKYYKNP